MPETSKTEDRIETLLDKLATDNLTDVEIAKIERKLEILRAQK